MEAVVPLEEIN
jgi:hypothetical protein